MKPVWYLFFVLILMIPHAGHSQTSGVQADQDTVWLGEVVKVSISSGEFLNQKGEVLGSWEVQQVDSQDIYLQTFSIGSLALPPLSFRLEMEGESSLDPGKEITVLPPFDPKEEPSARSIQGMMNLPASWTDWLPYILAFVGALLLGISWLLAISRHYGPSEKMAPPPEPAEIAVNTLQNLSEKDNPDQLFSQYQKLLRLYLSDLLMTEAGGLSFMELRSVVEQQLGATPASDQLLSLLQQRETDRFSGQSPTHEEASNFRKHLGILIQETKMKGEQRKQLREQQYGRPASAWKRILAGLSDLIPMALLASGLLLWPGFLTSIGLPSEEISGEWVLLISVGAGLLYRLIVGLVTETGSWKATPGMRIWRLSVVPVLDSQGSRLAFRPLFVFLASLPCFLGHLGILFSGKSLPDKWSASLVRYYPQTNK